MQCAIDAGVTYQTILRWVKAGKLQTKNIGLRKTYVEPEVWAKFCLDNNMKRGEE